MSNLKDIQQIQSLIAKGKGAGFLTFEEVNKALPVEMSTPEQFEEIIGIFEQLETDIVDTEKDGKKISAATTETDEEITEGPLHHPEAAPCDSGEKELELLRQSLDQYYASAQASSLSAAMRANTGIGDFEADLDYLRALKETLEKGHEQSY